MNAYEWLYNHLQELRDEASTNTTGDLFEDITDALDDFEGAIMRIEESNYDSID